MVDPDRLKELSEKSDFKGWLQVVSHFGAIGLTGWGIHATLGTGWVAPIFILHGILLNYLYAGQHEFSHSTVFKSPGLNEFFGRLFGLIVLHPRDMDQIQHFAHHRYTQLWREDGITQRELSERVGMREPTTVVALKGLEKAGFITRTKTAEDRRKTFIYLTPHAKKLELILAPLNAEVHKVATRGMTDEEVETLRLLMRRVVENLADETAKLSTLSDIKA